ncbi:MAG TPA: TetR/AcrR family transcriptional regulator [Polyangiaceae bacterium]
MAFSRTSAHPNQGDNTRERILVTAERLFAERGIEGVSVRTILSEAGVNVALAHRYFGGRDGLIDAVLRRAVGPLNERRLLLLEEVEVRGERATLEDVLRALFAPSMRWLYEQPERARLLAQLQTATDPKLRALHLQYFDAPLQRFAEAMVRTIVPRPGPLEFVCRFTFVNGALQAVYRHGFEVARLANKRLGSRAVPDERDWVEHIVAFCAAGLRAEVTPSANKRNRKQR